MTDVKVLWVTKGLGRGGAETLLVSLARAMDRTGITIDVAYRLPHKTALVGPLQDAGIRVHSLREGSLPWPLALRRLLRSGGFDIVHSHAPLVGAAARVVASRDSVLLHTEHNTWSRYHPATRLVNGVTLSRNQLVWAVSDNVAESIRPSWPFRTPPVAVMLHGVDLETVQCGPQARRRARDLLGIDETAFVYGTVGNLVPKKDHGTMLRAFAHVHTEMSDARLVLVGTGPREAELRALAERLHVGPAVHFLGMRDDVPELLPGLDVFVMSSLHEGLSIALVEALASGIPVVSTAVGGIPELISHGKHGVLVPSRNVVALRRAMLGLAQDGEERRRLAEAGRLRAGGFGIQAVADTLAGHYRAVAGSEAELTRP